MRKLWDEKEKASRALVEKGGAQIVEVDKKSFSDAMKRSMTSSSPTPSSRT